MSLPWFELHVDLPRHHKAVKLGLLLKEKTAWLRMVRVWMWLAENYPDGRVEDPLADDMVEVAADWRKAKGAFASALVDSRFAERMEGGGLFFRPWAERAAAHVAKKERDAERQKKRYERISGRFKGKPKSGPDSEDLQNTSRGEHAENGVRSRGDRSDIRRDSHRNSNPNPNRNPNPNTHLPSEEIDTTASQLAAMAPPAAGQDGFTLQPTPAAKPPRKPSKAEALYALLEQDRQAECGRSGVAYIHEDWAPARVNKQLGEVARLPSEEGAKFEAAWHAYLDAPENAAREPPYSLGFFLASRSKWAARAQTAATEAGGAP